MCPVWLYMVQSLCLCFSPAEGVTRQTLTLWKGKVLTKNKVVFSLKVSFLNSLNRQLYMLTLTQSVVFITPLARLHLQSICSQKMSIIGFEMLTFLKSCWPVVYGEQLRPPAGRGQCDSLSSAVLHCSQV